MKKQLQCGLCLKEGKEQTISLAMPLDLMMAMLTHWHYTHNDTIVPVFDQNTWRTGIVYPLDYTPAPRAYSFESTCGVCGKPIGGDGDVCSSCANSPPPVKGYVETTLEKEPVRAQIVIRQDPRTPPAYQCYVHIEPEGSAVFFNPHTDLADAHVESNVLKDVLSKVLGESNVIVLDCS